MSESDLQFQFAIDRGGTFTDIFCEYYLKSDPKSKKYESYKLLSVDPSNYEDASREGIRRLLEKHAKKPFPKDKPIDSSQIRSIRIGTTVATNALLERKGERMGLLITKGFKDLLIIGNQSRPEIFDLEIKREDALYEKVIEVEERVVLANSLNSVQQLQTEEGQQAVEAVTGEKLVVLQKPKHDKIREDLQSLLKEGINSVAIVLMHAYLYPNHEEEIGKIATELGFTQVSLSSKLLPRIKIVTRGQSTGVDAYLNPAIHRYITDFTKGFDENLLTHVKLFFMQSDGGLANIHSFSGVRAILSGPAGGAVGYGFTTYYNKRNQGELNKSPILGFDMGGTSTDVSRFSGTLEHTFETQTAGVSITVPQLDIHTVAAGGGSRLFFQNGLFKAGPESAGAHPGPICYRKNGYLAITDANLLLGRVVPKYFPHIFGVTQDQPLDEEGTKKAFEALTKQINDYYSENSKAAKSIYEVAYGFIKVANENMARAIRYVTQSKGLDPKHFVLSTFGGAGGQHACSLAKTLGMKHIFIHKLCGILSAFGIAMADVTKDNERPCNWECSSAVLDLAKPIITELEAENVKYLISQGFTENQIEHEIYLNLKYEGSDNVVMVAQPKDLDYAAAFKHRHQVEYGFILVNRKILVENVRVRSRGKGYNNLDLNSQNANQEKADVKPIDTSKVYFENDQTGVVEEVDTPVYKLAHLRSGSKLVGPAVILNEGSTIIVEPKCELHIDEDENIWIDVQELNASKGYEIPKLADPIQLSLFANRFMTIAEQMGHVLQRTSISTNIKERLDFSCAIFGPDGALVANAPHLPVHLGSMQEAVKFQINYLHGNWKEGEVVISNHPQAGGTHLPDMTVMSPVFDNGKAIFYVASRGHHADIGGITPGSMPPFSKFLHQEGIAIKSFKAVKDGNFQEEAVNLLMMNKLQDDGVFTDPGTPGSRNLKDNISDFKAQIAANNRGIELMTQLIKEYGLGYVQAYMNFIQENAANSVMEMLSEISIKQQMKEVDDLYYEDFMDDGSKVALKLTIDRKERKAVFDFEGTGPEILGNTNAPKAIVNSAIIYCLRCLVNSDIPLNQGCLLPVTIKVPEKCFLNPSSGAAVVGGNVLTSQRLTDVVLKAFRACADSQGCMNNLTFGTSNWGYYETVCGGSGAGPTWHGKSGVHTHMTNTRITDPEVLEKRYPVILREFGLRTNTGGKGKFQGGDGVVREIEFLEDINVNILSERRVFKPEGMNGGKNAERGTNLVIYKDGRVVSLGSKNSVNLVKGDRFRLLSPGGGGYGAPDS
jgi:5-oxoprolinase (ATP-hydrolysing)